MGAGKWWDGERLSPHYRRLYLVVASGKNIQTGMLQIEKGTPEAALLIFRGPLMFLYVDFLQHG